MMELLVIGGLSNDFSVKTSCRVDKKRCAICDDYIVDMSIKDFCICEAVVSKLCIYKPIYIYIYIDDIMCTDVMCIVPV